MAKKSAPDPRFDPRFQRGYDGPEPDAPPTPPVPSPIEPPGPSQPRATGGGPAPASAQNPDRSPGDAGGDDTDLWAPPRRNPYGIALLIGGLVMIGVGLWLIWTVVTASTYPDGNDRAAQALSLVQQQLTPALMIAGFLGIVGWLVLGALAAPTRRGE